MDSIVPEDAKLSFVICVDEKKPKAEYKIGRARNGDIKINIDSISREHAKISLDHGEFYVEDLDSTFGTMVLLTKPVCFQHKKKNGLCIQSGPTLFEIQYQREKQIEEIYVDKDGSEKKCAAYPNFKHKLPKVMRSHIDSNLEIVEINTPRKIEFQSEKTIGLDNMFDSNRQALEPQGHLLHLKVSSNTINQNYINNEVLNRIVGDQNESLPSTKRQLNQNS